MARCAKRRQQVGPVPRVATVAHQHVKAGSIDGGQHLADDVHLVGAVLTNWMNAWSSSGMRRGGGRRTANTVVSG